MNSKPNDVQADLAAAMINLDNAAEMLATLSEAECRDYLAAAVVMGAAMVREECAVLRAHNVKKAGPVLTFLRKTLTADRF